LFDLPKIIKYKKGTVDEKRSGLQSLATHIGRLAHARPSLTPNDLLVEILYADLSTLRGAALKHHEDILDAIVCAYVSCYLCHWRWDENEVFGSVQQGYISNPKLVPGGLPSNS
jgi:predicted RNase H-like nuclease